MSGRKLLRSGRRRLRFILIFQPFVLYFRQFLEIVGEPFVWRWHMLRSVCHKLQAVGQPFERVRDRVSGRCQQFAQDQRHELPLACRESVKRVLLQVIRNQVVEPLLLRRRNEFLHEGMPVRVLDVFEHLLAQRPFADRLEPLFQFGKIRVASEPRKLSAKALEVAESEFVDDADESVKLKKGVL